MTCPGWYCGRELLLDGTLTACGACPRGFRRNDTNYICEPCQDTPIFYDWLYLGFMVLLVLVLHWFFIDMVAMNRSFNKNILILHFTAFLEVLLSCIFTILCVEPFGLFQIRSCNVRSLSDWYTLLYNPSPNYEKRVHCTQEAVYPLYSVVFVFYAFALGIMLLVRPWICKKFLPRNRMSIYAAMYFIPILTLIHALIGGLLYYSFPYLIVILSVISSAAHFAGKMNQSISYLIIFTFIEPRNIVILLGHWALHAYGIVSITQLTNPTFHALLIFLVPLPAAFYILTSRFTDPSKFHVM
ncbi:PREDICTED: JNK1/MAPK8-associated membrane protein [Nicrophorus vespilloides]|uniref:JNK1/MAPK8-associated membrane protein n=1 Tax=Nicrophorus vespilloides TaxID=110193 RepID=A0ABM1MYH7_NICVS|nr:PREDICTED: JNK1/MAPK8-associated membrane protein [Nicrophorus vespilloides]